MVQEVAVVDKSWVLEELVLRNPEVGGIFSSIERIISGGPPDSEDHDVPLGDNANFLPALIPLGYIFIGGFLAEIAILAIGTFRVDIGFFRIGG